MKASEYSTIQSFPWADSITAVKESENFQLYNDFHVHLSESLPQNSPTTRKKFANVIQRRFFPDRLGSLAPIVWRSYHDEDLLMDVMRVITLGAEPAISEFINSEVLTRSPGDAINSDTTKSFITSIYGEFKVDSYNRLNKICCDLGFLSRYKKNLLVKGIPQSKNALFILMHAYLASTPRIVRLSDILETDWWRWIGFSTIDDLREAFKQADDEDLIARFVKVDDLEQLTTRYSLKEYLEGAYRL